jgi:hypothetical protein
VLSAWNLVRAVGEGSVVVSIGWAAFAAFLGWHVLSEWPNVMRRRKDPGGPESS